ncbi:MAG: metal ABC transporter permease [Spirochaetota bacterium]
MEKGMVEAWYTLIEVLPFSWTEYAFMKNALLAILIVSPCFGLIGAAVISNRMAFFSDGMGHSALTGIALGALIGFSEMFIPMILFAVVFAFAINFFSEKTGASSDTVIAVFTSFSVALGIALLTGGSSFRKYSVYLVGDILSVNPADIFYLLIMAFVVFVFFLLFGSYLSLIGIEPSLAYRKSIPPYAVKTLFSILLAVLIVLSIRWMGILIINSLFILPAASARLWTRSLKTYNLISIVISLISGITGLLISYYSGCSCGAAIALCAAFIYAGAIAVKSII